MGRQGRLSLVAWRIHEEVFLVWQNLRPWNVWVLDSTGLGQRRLFTIIISRRNKAAASPFIFVESKAWPYHGRSEARRRAAGQGGARCRGGGGLCPSEHREQPFCNCLRKREQTKSFLNRVGGNVYRMLMVYLTTAAFCSRLLTIGKMSLCCCKSCNLMNSKPGHTTGGPGRGGSRRSGGAGRGGAGRDADGSVRPGGNRPSCSQGVENKCPERLSGSTVKRNHI